MADGAVIEFGGRGAYLGLTLIERPFPDAESDWDRDTVRVHVTIEAEDFHGEFGAFTWSHELAHLRRVLQALDEDVLDSQERLFRLLDADLWLTFKLGHRGDIELEVESRRGAVPYEARLLYTITADQSYLHQWIRVIDEALTRYPPLFDEVMSLREGDPCTK
jgi:hypothetical protein